MSVNIDTSILRDLGQFGLNPKEALVYTTLLQIGDTGTSKIEKLSGLHRQFVYDALAALSTRGLAHFYIEKNHKRWVAEPPRTFLGLADEQMRLATKLHDQLGAISSLKNKQEFNVIEGASAFQERQIETAQKVKVGTIFLMICGMWEKYFESMTLSKFEEYERIRRRRNLSIRFIGPRGTKTQLTVAKETRHLVEYRYLEGLDRGIVNTIIYDNVVDFEIYGNPHLTFSVKNKDVAESQRSFFETLWTIGHE